jgi:tryptophan synthase beta chain
MSDHIQFGTVDLPTDWFNIRSAIPYDLPLPIDGNTGEPFSFEKLKTMYSSECARIELQMGAYGKEGMIPIPAPVLDEYRKYRPTPIFRARGFERALGYEGAIYFKREDMNPSGSHKPNTALPQAYYAKEDGLTQLVTDTGAGQWGAALAYSCLRFGIECTVFMRGCPA